jgi:hypothetical protein
MNNPRVANVSDCQTKRARRIIVTPIRGGVGFFE